MQHAVNPGRGNLFSRLEDFHTAPSNLDAAYGTLQKANRLGGQCRTASQRLYGNSRRRFEVGVAPVAITTLDAPPPLTAVGTDPNLHDRNLP